MKNFKSLLFLLTFCLYAHNAEPEFEVEIEKCFHGFNQGFNNSADYTSYAYSRLYLKEKSYEDHSFGVSIGALNIFADEISKQFDNVVLEKIIRYCPMFYYDVVHAHSIYNSGPLSLFYGFNWKFNTLPVHFIFSAHYRENRHLFTIGLQKNVWMIYSDVYYKRTLTSFVFQTSYSYSF